MRKPHKLLVFAVIAMVLPPNGNLTARRKLHFFGFSIALKKCNFGTPQVQFPCFSTLKTMILIEFGTQITSRRPNGLAKTTLFCISDWTELEVILVFWNCIFQSSLPCENHRTSGILRSCQLTGGPIGSLYPKTPLRTFSVRFLQTEY